MICPKCKKINTLEPKYKKDKDKPVAYSTIMKCTTPKCKCEATFKEIKSANVMLDFLESKNKKTKEQKK